MPRKKKVEKSCAEDSRPAIKLEDDRESYLAYMAMFRYAFGSTTYMPHNIISIIKSNAQSLSPRLLNQLDKELTEAAEDYERVYKGRQPENKPTNYGLSHNRDEWLSFHEWVKRQIAISNCR